MLGDGKQIAPQEMGSFGVGVAATIATGLIATVSQVPLALIAPISLGLGLAAWFGAHQIRLAIEEGQIAAIIRAEYLAKLSEIRRIAERIGDISQSGFLPAKVAGQLSETNRILLRLLRRFDARQNIPWASATLLIVERFILMVEEYHDIQCGELFVRDAARKAKIANMEQRVLPLLIATLNEIGIKLDEGRFQSEVLLATMEDIANSLGLLESLKQQLGEPPQEEDSHE